jgi:hypothetical protein
MATPNRRQSLHRQSLLHRQGPLSFQWAAHYNKCFADICNQNGKISGERTVNSAIELGQVGGSGHVEAEGD